MRRTRPAPVLAALLALLALAAAGPGCGGDPDADPDAGGAWDAGEDPAQADGGATDAGSGDAGVGDGDAGAPTPPEPGFEPLEVHLGQVAVGERREATVTLWNRGETPCTFDVEVVDYAHLFDAAPLEGVVPAEGEVTITIGCEPPETAALGDPRTAVVYAHTDAPYPRHRLSLYATCTPVP